MTQGPSPTPTPAASGTSAGRRWLRYLLAALLFATTASGLVLLWLHSHGAVSTDNAYVVGNITAVSADVGGTVVALYTDDNMTVRAGDPIAQIDPVPFQYQVDQALADRQQAQADLKAAEVNVHLVTRDRKALLEGARARLGEAEQMVKAAETEVRKVEQIHEKEQEVLSAQRARLPGLEALAQNARDYKRRFDALGQSGDIPVQERDNREAAYQEALARVEELKSLIKSAERQVLASEQQRIEASVRLEQSRKGRDSSQAGVGRAEAEQLQPDVAEASLLAARGRLGQAEAKLRLARLALSNSLVRAPQGGIVSRRTIQLGQTVVVRQPFLSIVPLDLDNVWVVANLREDQMARVRVGQPVRIALDAIPERDFAGWVESVSGGTGSVFSVFPPDNATGNFTRVVQRLPVRVRFRDSENYQDRIRPGLSARILIDEERLVRQGDQAW